MNLTATIKTHLAGGRQLSLADLAGRCGAVIDDAAARKAYGRLEAAGSKSDRTDAEKLALGRQRLVQEAAQRLVHHGVVEADGRGAVRQYRLKEGSPTVAADIREIPLAELQMNGETQTRTGTDPAVVAEYAEAYRDGKKLPPIVVFEDTQLEILWPADGYHRIEARADAGFDTINAVVIQGDRMAAILYAVGANADHGLRRSDADRRRAVEMFAREFPEQAKSVNHVARACRVSWDFADKILNPADRHADGRTKINKANRSPAREPTAAPGPAPEPKASRAGSKSAKAGKGKPAAEPEPADASGRTIPQKLRDVMADRWHADTARQLDGIKAAARSAMDWNPWLAVELLDRLNDLAASIRAAAPHQVCGDCGGDGCAVCMKSGFLPLSVPGGD